LTKSTTVAPSTVSSAASGSSAEKVRTSTSPSAFASAVAERTTKPRSTSDPSRSLAAAELVKAATKGAR